MTDPAQTLPQLAVACPTCGAEPEELCILHAFGPRLPYSTHQARTTAWKQMEAGAAASPEYPDPGSAIPGQPGFVVATCGHRVAAQEWRAGFRVCERCPAAQEQVTEVSK